jgi:hypothetical protein
VYTHPRRTAPPPGRTIVSRGGWLSDTSVGGWRRNRTRNGAGIIGRMTVVKTSN